MLHGEGMQVKSTSQSGHLARMFSNRRVLLTGDAHRSQPISVDVPPPTILPPVSFLLPRMSLLMPPASISPETPDFPGVSPLGYYLFCIFRLARIESRTGGWPRRANVS